MREQTNSCRSVMDKYFYELFLLKTPKSPDLYKNGQKDEFTIQSTEILSKRSV